MSGPVVLLTGASRGIGAAAALALAGQGARLALCSRRGAEGVEAVDVTDPAACESFVRATVERFGRLDALVCNAGVVTPMGLTAEVDPAEWRHAVDVNLLGPFYLARAALPWLRQSRGRLVNVTTGAALQPLPHVSAYCASKAGVTHLTRVLAVEEPEVVCLSFSPGTVDTDMQGQVRQLPGALGAYFTELQRTGQLVEPARAGRILAWLALQAPRDWSGQMIDLGDRRLRGM